MKRSISLMFLALLVVVGCSKITPAPEIIIVDIDPVGGISAGSSVDIIFENKNDIDAIITKCTTTYTDTMNTAPIVESDNISLYINANTATVTLTRTFGVLPALGGPTAGRSLQMVFTGTDAYGYNKTFTVTTPKICY
jgi:hypothetical protein